MDTLDLNCSILSRLRSVHYLYGYLDPQISVLEKSGGLHDQSSYSIIFHGNFPHWLFNHGKYDGVCLCSCMRRLGNHFGLDAVVD